MLFKTCVTENDPVWLAETHNKVVDEERPQILFGGCAWNEFKTDDW